MGWGWDNDAPNSPSNGDWQPPAWVIVLIVIMILVVVVGLGMN